MSNALEDVTFSSCNVVSSAALPLACFGLSHDRHKSPYWVSIVFNLHMWIC